MEALVARCLDVTTLDDASDTIEKVLRLCTEAADIKGESAASVCVFPRFVPYAKRALKGKSTAVCTTVNFPQGEDDIEICETEIQACLAYGADEIDFVFPYSRWMKGDAGSIKHVKSFVSRAVKACRSADSSIVVKVILETGVLSDENSLRSAARLCIDAGVNFLKTSTGKVEVGARPEEVKILADEIVKSKQAVGLKVSGGVRTLQDAKQYIEIATATGMTISDKSQFRIGASKLHLSL
eukprot:Gregarina_sp_Poly_1__1229@NODE_12_length_23383_cov_104_521445_g10_i0_p8_GENE_NODE_12_length_23383_cov_104_521445_g10_i0NODE_12_length_23383_cov_104_521445_g10_i0_p8_ORF_typecomplete_len240_score40_93DeoC/PF01791_9/3e44Dus/PF01207_17/0_084DUF5086/PF16985_5/8_1DUF5086/PF16985_5/2_1e02DUF5086/PF16985_5/7_6e02_NODE_12_length_23383_cov_104_521445_g10_i01933420053